MRYLFRRPNANQFSDLKTEIPDLESKLGAPAADLRRLFEVPVSKTQSVVYQFFTTQSGKAWAWTCPSVELVAESEPEFYALTDRMKIPRSQLSHLPHP